MIDLIKSFPPVPDTLGYDNYLLIFNRTDSSYKVIYYNKFNKNLVYDYNTTHRLNPDNLIEFEKCVIYDFNNDFKEWALTSGWSDISGRTAWIRLDNTNVAISSSQTIYNNDDSVYISGLTDTTYNEHIGVIGETITGNTFYNVFDGIFTIAPILIVAVVALIAFRKAWAFITNAVRGA